ncbi:ribitol-5-phosphate dehydrogenase [Periweissella cryptocerci]|uniref:Ribitol-5-phosphate dehydrogenase n=1 Tax=Periweissella cryptocerci TaxID=2506420 RepID=A0A4P6YSG2_9LACO|nr:alcohol dehydrogenase catalytic domain-containing protein [Periweissella cryptocerci]QBO35601.1 ribitol-5-phosphate dehydrogenase [Periweissella cryptocerci]
MLNHVYRLVSAKQFEVALIEENLKEGQVVVRPKLLSLCHADQRYYAFQRSPEVLAKKIPMALIHEGMGTVVESKSPEFNPGDEVIIVPTTPVEHSDTIAENYLPSSKFRSSGFDGLMQEYVISDAERVVKLPTDFDSEVAAFTEMISVGYQAATRLLRVAGPDRESVGIWGDGNVSYMTAAILHVLLPEMKIYVFGHHDYKLSYYSFATKTYVTDAIPDDLELSMAVEATGGNGSHDAISQIIDHIKPEGSVVLMGVSENEIPVNTRMILEKGLTLIGSSRSTKQDFEDVVKLLSGKDELLEEMRLLVSLKVPVTSVEDAIAAFEADNSNGWGKTIMEWKV